jgi:molybdate transport system regulatory protein
MDDAQSRLRIRLVVRGALRMGPGRADLLEGIRETGSIGAAGRRMRMSYKRAWSLVEALNAGFRAPLVETARGGAGRGGARLTPLGERVLAAWRRLEARAAEGAAEELAELRAAAAAAPSEADAAD